MLPDMDTDALISPCGAYRYHLSRTWDHSAPTLNIIGLNPSTADALQNDPTIRRCIGFALDNGFGRLYVTNLFAYRATHPKDLFKAPAPVGPDNDHWLKHIATQSACVLYAWGNHGTFQDRDQLILPLLPEGYCLGLNQTGTPKHPLYVKKDQSFIPFPK